MGERGSEGATRRRLKYVKSIGVVEEANKKYAKSIRSVAKGKQVTNTYGFLTSLITTLQSWKPEATIPYYFTCKPSHPTRGGQDTWAWPGKLS